MFKRADLSYSYRLNHIPSHLSAWLYASGSLTAQLKQLSRGEFQVRPVKESFQRLSKEQSQWLNMPLHHIAWVREAILYGADNVPWIKALSIFPILSLQKQARIFKYIGNKPIGMFLFNRTTPECERRVLKMSEGWTRQSRYTWHDCPFIVQETFLVSFEAYLNQQEVGN